jgi:hypothetical protein
MQNIDRKVFLSGSDFGSELALLHLLDVLHAAGDMDFLVGQLLECGVTAPQGPVGISPVGGGGAFHLSPQPLHPRNLPKTERRHAASHCISWTVDDPAWDPTSSHGARHGAS